ncbi:MAG: flagellar hook-length control protein FliK [Butyrivibrio sp.]|nr:flagellar hook-length control protein FliK [Butyrivibrio sp.]
MNGSDLGGQNVAPKQIEVKTGATIQGTVVSVSDTGEGKIANINVGDGQIQAKLADSMELREGQTINFLVRGSGANGVTISPLYENTSADQSTLKALTAAGIEITNDTIQMVKEMMETGLSIDKSSLLDMNKNLSLFPNTSISTMVEMKSLNIPVNETNIEQFGSYKNYEHQVISDMTEIMNALPDAFSALSESGNVNGAINLYGEVLKLFAENAGMGQQAAETATVAGQQGVDTAQAQSQQAAIEGTLISANSGEEATQINGQMANGEQTPQINGGALLNPNEISGAPSGDQAVYGGAEAPSEQVNGQMSDKAMLIGGQSMDDEQVAGTNPGKTFSPGFLDNLRNLNASESAIQSLSKDPGLLLKELAQSFDETTLNNPVEVAAWKKLFSSDEYNKILKDTMESQWLLKPGDVEKKENIENLYQRLGTQAKALADAINNSPMANSNLGQAANNLSNNLDFMNQLNQMFQYVQLPLQMTGQNVHGDLYVYQNKHKKLSEDGSVSAVLHLDMENLGPVDVFVKLLDTKVTTNFYVMDDEVLTLINDNIHILNERLEKRGYTMQVNLKLHDDMDGQDAAVDEMLDVTRTPILSTASFDARA